MSALSSITDVARVRSLGGLSDNEDTGAPNAAQIEAAIAVGQLKLRDAVGRESYDATRDFTPEALAVAENKKKRLAYSAAEAYFALSALPLIVKYAQIGQTGLANVTTVGGQATTSFANAKESKATGDPFEALAYAAIADYRIYDPEADADDDTGFESEDGEVSLIAM
jgi:hypothetical protein